MSNGQYEGGNQKRRLVLIGTTILIIAAIAASFLVLIRPSYRIDLPLENSHQVYSYLETKEISEANRFNLFLDDAPSEQEIREIAMQEFSARCSDTACPIDAVTSYLLVKEKLGDSPEEIRTNYWFGYYKTELLRNTKGFSMMDILPFTYLAERVGGFTEGERQQLDSYVISSEFREFAPMHSRIAYIQKVMKYSTFGRLASNISVNQSDICGHVSEMPTGDNPCRFMEYVNDADFCGKQLEKPDLAQLKLITSKDYSSAEDEICKATLLAVG